MSASSAPQALFLDRDGTLIVDKKYLSDPAGVELLPGVREALAEAVRSGCRLFLFSNQSGVGRGYFTLAEVEACNRRMVELLDLPAPGFMEVCIAPERPDEPSLYRKPSPRFIVEMAAKYQLDPAQIYMIGDKLSDVEAGLAANVNAALVRNRRDAPPAGVERFEDVLEFVRAHFAGA